MRVLKNALIGLGILFVVVVGLLVWVKSSSSQFSKEQAPFVEAFISDLSQRWDLADVYDRLAIPFAEQVGTPQAQKLLQQFKRLGKLQSVHDVELERYNADNLTQTGIFFLTGTFENGEAMASVTVVKKGGATRVQSVYIKGAHRQEGSPKLQT